jgi:hypothetical protein
VSSPSEGFVPLSPEYTVLVAKGIRVEKVTDLSIAIGVATGTFVMVKIMKIA